MAGNLRRRVADWRDHRGMNDAPGPPPDQSGRDDESRQILEELAEGVVLVDPDRTVRWLNPAARQMVAAIDQPAGRLLVEVIRDHRLDALAGRARASQVDHSLEIALAVSPPTPPVRAVPP